LKHSKAKVFVDNSHDPIRLRHLRRIPSLELKNVYLVRDPRGVAFSHKKNKGWDVALSTRLWLRRQYDILRLSEEFPETLQIYYEDLSSAVDETLASIHKFVGLKTYPFSGDFKLGEHHILGNRMRLRDGEVRQDIRWKKELSTEEQKIVTRSALDFANRHQEHPVADITDYGKVVSDK